MVASELGMGVLSRDPLEKLRHILEAFQLIEEKTPILTAANITEEEVRALYESCLGLSQIYGLERGVGHISWPFSASEAAWKLFWLRLIFDDLLPEERRVEIKEALLRGSEGVWGQYRIALYLYSQCCHISIAHILRSHFISQAMPIAMRLMQSILQYYIPPETWQLALSLVKGGQAREEDLELAGTSIN